MSGRVINIVYDLYIHLRYPLFTLTGLKNGKTEWNVKDGSQFSVILDDLTNSYENINVRMEIKDFEDI